VSSGNAYAYRLRAVDSREVAGAWSNYDLATAIVFSDDPSIPGSTPIGTRFFDPKNSSVVHVLERGFASGKSLLVARNVFTGRITTVISGVKLIRARFLLLP